MKDMFARAKAWTMATPTHKAIVFFGGGTVLLFVIAAILG